MKTESEDSPSIISPVESNMVLDEDLVRESIGDIVVLDEEGLEDGFGAWEPEEKETLEDLVKKIPLLPSRQIVTGPVFSAESWAKWKEIPNEEWTYRNRYLVNGQEKFVGTRKIEGEKYVVYWCLDDSFVAQRFDGDAGRDFYVPDGKPTEKPISWGPPPPSSNEGAIRFPGRNFKLAGLRKWKIVMPREQLGSLRYICEHQIESRKYKVYEAEDRSFVAFPIDDDSFLV